MKKSDQDFYTYFILAENEEVMNSLKSSVDISIIIAIKLTS